MQLIERNRGMFFLISNCVEILQIFCRLFSQVLRLSAQKFYRAGHSKNYYYITQPRHSQICDTVGPTVGPQLDPHLFPTIECTKRVPISTIFPVFMSNLSLATETSADLSLNYFLLKAILISSIGGILFGYVRFKINTSIIFERLCSYFGMTFS